VRTVVLAGLILLLGALGVYGSWHAVVGEKSAPAAAEASTGDLVYRQGNYSVRLLEKPCGFEELRSPLEEDGGMGDPHAAVIMEGARRISGCWMRNTDEAHVQDLAGHGGSLPLSWFKREPGT
jgi:hypothetical protein